MLQISQRINSLAASATLAMSQRSNELRAAGVDVYVTSDLRHHPASRISTRLISSKRPQKKPLTTISPSILRCRAT